MRGIARQIDKITVPENLQDSFGQYLLSPGVEYEIHAVSVFNGAVYFQVQGETWPLWYPAWAFDVTDSSIPRDWVCVSFRDEPALVMGPPFMAQTTEAYDAMVELKPKMVDQFWERVELLQKKPQES